MDFAILGAGCFWCIEALFLNVPGIISVEVGYTGGYVKNPSYEAICSGSTGHAEVCKVGFDSKVITYNQILNVFWKIHDPTTLNQQGADMGTQYRSVVFYHNDTQREIAETSLKAANKAEMYENRIVTEITPLSTFYPAEKYHQDYYRRNSNAPYCKMVIQPKLKKLFDSD